MVSHPRKVMRHAAGTVCLLAAVWWNIEFTVISSGLRLFQSDLAAQPAVMTTLEEIESGLGRLSFLPRLGCQSRHFLLVVMISQRNVEVRPDHTSNVSIGHSQVVVEAGCRALDKRIVESAEDARFWTLYGPANEEARR